MEVGSVFLFVLFVGIALLVLNILTSVWAYRDSTRKGKNSTYSLVVLIGTLFFPLVGLIVYVIIRND